MNIFIREIKAHRNSLIGWCIGMILLLYAGMAKYAAYQSTGQSINDLMNSLPKTFLAVFGVSGFDLTKASGYYGLLYLYIALMVAIHAVLIGSDMIAKEERDRTSEFLFVKPVTRAYSITAKLLAGLVNIVILNLITGIFSYLTVRSYAKGESIGHEIILFSLGFFFIQLIFFALGAAIAGMSRKPKGVAGVTTGILLATYLIYILININDKLDFLKFITPFKYFDAKITLAEGHLSIFFIVLSIIISLVFTAATYHYYQKRDLNI